METTWRFAGEEFEAEATELVEGLTLKPYAGCDVIATRDDSEAVAVSWKRRSRYRGAVLNDPPLGESLLGEYEVEILNGGEVVRTITTTDTEFEYSAAQQVADFGSVQSQISVRIYMNSLEVGRGYPLEATI